MSKPRQRLAEVETLEEQKNGRPGIEEAQAILEEAQRKKMQACQAEVEAALKKYGCRIDVALVLRPGSITPVIQIVVE